METILLPVKAKHFKDAIFISICNCPIANAAKEFFNLDATTDYVNEGVDVLHIKETSYRHKIYGDAENDRNMLHAEAHNYDETVIFELELTKR